jgi:hypothetical protein
VPGMLPPFSKNIAVVLMSFHHWRLPDRTCAFGANA